MHSTGECLAGATQFITPVQAKPSSYRKKSGPNKRYRHGRKTHKVFPSEKTVTGYTQLRRHTRSAPALTPLGAASGAVIPCRCCFVRACKKDRLSHPKAVTVAVTNITAIVLVRGFRRERDQRNTPFVSRRRSSFDLSHLFPISLRVFSEQTEDSRVHLDVRHVSLVTRQAHQ